MSPEHKPFVVREGEDVRNLIVAFVIKATPHIGGRETCLYCGVRPLTPFREPHAVDCTYGLAIQYLKDTAELEDG